MNAFLNLARCARTVAALAGLIGALVVPAAFSDAQCTPGPKFYCVVQGVKTAANPNPGGFTCCTYYINDIEAPELTLVRGETYTFKMNDIPSFHPFYISTSVTGSGASVWSLGVTPSTGVSGTQTLTFTVPASAPAQLYYQCRNHQRMGWKLNIVDTLLCPSDFDGDGFVTGDDFDAFVGAFAAGDLKADFDKDGFVTGDDFDAYVVAFESGC